jgi:hypothetical protein
VGGSATWKAQWILISIKFERLLVLQLSKFVCCEAILIGEISGSHCDSYEHGVKEYQAQK